MLFYVARWSCRNVISFHSILYQSYLIDMTIKPLDLIGSGSTITHPSTYFLYRLSYTESGTLGNPGAYPRELREQGGGQPGRGAKQDTIVHTFTHYGQFRDANQSTAHVFWTGGGNPSSVGRTPVTLGGGGNRTPYPRDVNKGPPTYQWQYRHNSTHLVHIMQHYG